MEFNIASAIHIISILATSLLAVLINKVIFMMLPTTSDRRRLINAFATVIFFIVLNYINVYKYLPWFDQQEYTNAVKTLIVYFSVKLFFTCLDYFVWNGIAKNRHKPGVPQILINIFKIIIYFVTIAMCAKIIYGMQLTTLLASAGLLSFILGYASKDTLSNLFAGIAIQIGGKMKKGQLVKVGKIQGVITEFNWRSTTIETTINYAIVPNTELAHHDVIIINQQNTNSTYYHYFVIIFPIRTDHTQVLNLCKETIKECSPLGKGSAYIAASKLSELEVEIAGGVNCQSQVLKMKTDFHSALRNKLDKANLIIGAPLNLTLNNEHIVERVKPPRQDDAIKLIQKNTVFCKISSQMIQSLIEENEIKYFVQGETVIKQNFPGDSLFIILEGAFDTYEWHEGINEKMRSLEAADLFGLKAFLTNEPRRITVKCQSQYGWLLEITREKFKQTQEKYPDLIEELSAILINRETENLKKHEKIYDQATDLKTSQILLNKISELFNIKK